MSIGIGGKIFGKGFELYLGKRKYSHSFTIATASVLKLDESFTMLTLEIALRW